MKDDELDDALAKTKEAGELKPFMDGLETVAKHSVDVDKKLTKTADDIRKEFSRGLEDLKNEVCVSLEDVAERQKRLSAASLRHAADFLPRIESVNVLREAIPDTVKQMANRFEHQIAPTLPKKMQQPEVAMAVHAWWVRASQAQCLRKHGANLGRISAEMEKLERALGEYHYGDAKLAEIASKAALAEDADATGGYLVPTIIASEVMRLVTDASKITPLCRPWPMTKKVEQVPNEATAVTINWIDEAGTLTAGDPTFGQTTLTSEKLAGRSTMSVEVFEDSNVALLPYLLSVFSEKMAGELDYQMILGDGSGPQITGVMSASGINAVTSATAAGRALTWQLLVDTFTGASEGSARDGGYWFCSPKGYAALLGLVDDQGRPIVQMNVQGAPAGAILGKPIIESARLGGNLTLDDVTNTATKIVFGPPRVILFGTRTGMRWDVTDQVNWATYQMDARLIGRFAGNVGVPAAFTYLGQVAYT